MKGTPTRDAPGVTAPCGELPPPIRHELGATIRRLLAPGMGILAADESIPTIGRRFEKVGVRSTKESRRTYRELLFSAPGIGEQVSGVILFDETIPQRSSDGVPFPRLLEERGAVPGIKVDMGAKPHAPVDEVAAATVSCLRTTVPPAVIGIVFLSGGQTQAEATAHLAAMNAAGPHPWVLTFSYSRALQDPVLETWRGDETKVTEAQEVFAERARLNGLARLGRLDGDVS